MGIDIFDQIRASLLEKRLHLSNWLQATPQSERDIQLGLLSEQAVQEHLDHVDHCLEKVECGELGMCEVCHQGVDSSLLEMDYTAQVCLEHLSREEISKLELELELAQNVQRSLLPQQLPDSPHLEFSAFSRPAQMIGGDYFDFFQFADGGQGLTIADVAGHGVSAALHMASIQALLRTLIPVNSSPKEVLSHIQRLLIHNVNFSNFVTIFLASFDAATHLLKYTNAGHTPPLLLRPNGAGLPFTDWLYPTGAAIGLIEELLMQEAVIAVQPGDVLVMVTDGVTEAMDASGEQFGYERLTQAASKAMEGPSREIVQALRQDLLEFTGQENMEDDTTILVCKILG